MFQSFKLSVGESWIAVVFKQFPLFFSLSRHQSSFIFLLFTCTPLSHQQLLSLYSFTYYPIWCIATIDYSCVHREVCVIGKAGKGTSIEKGRCFWSCIVLRVASDREYPTHTTGIPLSAPPHRTLVDFLSEVPLFERVGRVLRWSWRKPVVVVSSTEKNCRFNIVTYRHAKRSYVSNVRWLAHLYSVIKFFFCFVVSSLHNNKKCFYFTNDWWELCLPISGEGITS